MLKSSMEYVKEHHDFQEKSRIEVIEKVTRVP